MSEEVKVDQKSVEVNEGRPYLIIAMDAHENIGVSGWTQDLPLVDEMLFLAHDACRDLHDKKARIQRVNMSGGLMKMIRHGLKKK